MSHDGIKPGVKYADIRMDVRVTFRDDGFLDLNSQAIEELDNNDYEVLFTEVIEVRDTEQPQRRQK